jgi:two-component system chemotaxis response regulator CheB
LPAAHATDGEQLLPGRIYIAPPDYHLLVHSGFVRTVRGPKENHCRPAIDPLFRSAARVYGPRVVGVVLSGSLSDGAAGLSVVKGRGGVTVVQDPADASFPDMPRAAMLYVKIDHVLPLPDIVSLLVRLAYEPVPEQGVTPVSNTMEKETDLAEFDLETIENQEKPGTPSAFACPECGGTLWELQDGELLRFRCRTGHAYSAESLLATQVETLEAALWSALRALEENAALARRMAARAYKHNRDLAAANFEERARMVEQQAALVRQVLLHDKTAKAAEKSEAS